MIKNVNETVTEILAGIDIPTYAGIFKAFLEHKNEVQEYFKDYDIEGILADLEKEHSAQKENASLIKDAERCIEQTCLNVGQHRYHTETTFFVHMINGDRNAHKFFNSVFGKYVKPGYALEDLSNKIPVKPNMNWEANKGTILDTFGRNLTELAETGELPTIVDRNEEIHRIIQVLTRQTKANPVLVGEAGVGKTAIVEKLADLIQKKKGIPSSLHGWKIYELSIPAVIATQKVDEIMPAIISAAIKDKVILFIDEIHVINANNGKIANLLKPEMARGNLKLIGATTEDEFKTFEKDKAMMRRFQPVKIEEPDKISVYRILKTKAEETEKFHNVIIPEKSLLKAIALSEKYITSRKQPDKAIDLVEEASAKLRMILEAEPEVIVNLKGKKGDAELQLEMLCVKNEQLSDRDKKTEQDLKEKIQKYTQELDKYNKMYSEQRKKYDRCILLKEEIHQAEELYNKLLHQGEFDDAITAKEIVDEKQQELQQAEKDLLAIAESNDEKLIQNVVVPDMISRIIEDITGIPVSAQDQDDLEKYKNIEVSLKEKVHGQDKAIDTISAAIKRSKAGLAEGTKPLGSFLCLGPTGVGKTYLAQKLAEFMFDTEKVMHRFDMSEYMEPHSISRFIGSPPGYVGHNEGGQLTELVKRNPYSIILFDEIEKAHPKIFDAFLQILDAGRLTDGQGNTVDFKNTVIIMTSNIGSDIIREGLEKGYPEEAIERALDEEVRKKFRPEFLNRLDAKVLFKSLHPEAIRLIAESELKKLAERLNEENELDFYWHKDVPTYITNKAYNIMDGARPIKRFINDVIINMLVEKMLNQEISKGDTVYLGVDVSTDSMTLFAINPKDLKELQESETEEVALKNVLKNSTISAQKEPTPTKSVKFKKKKKKKKNQSWLDTEVGE